MRMLKNSFYSFSGTALPVLVSIITIPLYIAEIGMERYGALAIAWLLLGYFGQADFGIGRAITQRIAANPEASPEWRARAVSSAFASISGFSLVGAALIYGAARYYFSEPFQISDDLRLEILAGVWLLALSNPVVALGGVASGAMMGLERFGLVAAATMAGNIGMQLLPLFYAIFYDANLADLILAALIGRMIGLVLLFAAVWSAFFRTRIVAPSFDEMRKLTGFGVWIMVTALVGPLMIFADRFVIGSIESAFAVAVYTIPFQLAARTAIFPNAIVQALFPRFANAGGVAARDKCRDYTIFVGQIFAPVTLGLICLAGPLFRLWLGDQLDERSILIGQILLASFWINSVANVPFSYVQASGNPRFAAQLHLAELPVYAGLLVLLGSAFGLAGFAAAFGLRCLIDWVAMVLKSGAGFPHILSRLAAQFVLILSAIGLANVIESHWVLLLCAGALAMVSVFVSTQQMPHFFRDRLSQIPFVGAGIALMSVRKS